MATKLYCMKGEHVSQGNDVSFREIIPNFCKQSTIHGLQHVGKTTGYIKFITWLVLVLCSTAGLIYNAYTITSSYLDYLVYVKIDIHDSKELAFPAVTVCNTNPVKKSELSNSPRMEALIASWKLDGSETKTRKKRAACPNPVEPVSGVCFWREDTGRLSWADAKQHCEDIGASLAVVDTPEKFTHIFQNPLQLASDKSVWLNLKYSEVAGTWQWAESVDLAWSNWESEPGSPPSSSDKTCVYVSYETDQTTWRNVQCDGVHSWIVFGLRPLCMDRITETVQTTTEAITTIEPTTAAPTTIELTTEAPTTMEPTTADQTTIEPTAEAPTTIKPTTTAPTTIEPTTEAPTTIKPTTTAPTTIEPTTEAPTTIKPTTAVPTTIEPTTAVPTTIEPTTAVPTTIEPTTAVPTTIEPTTAVPTTIEPTTAVPTTIEPTTTVPTTIEPTTADQTTIEATTQAPTTIEPTTAAKTTVQTTSKTHDHTTSVKETTFIPTTVSSSQPENASLILNADGKVLREDFKREGDVMRILSDITDEEKKSLGYKYPEFVLECSFNGQACAEKDFDPFFDAVYGNCYVFNSGWNHSHSLYTATLSGRLRGLQLLVNVGQHEYIKSVGQQAGAVVVVHDQNRMPFPEDEGILAVPGYVTSVGTKKVSVERLGSQYSDCITDTDSVQQTVYKQLYGVNYSLNACEKTCYQNEVINTCACADPQYPTAESANQIPACDARNKTQGDCMNSLTILYIEDKLNCDCPLPCSSIMYTYRVSKTMWPSDVELDTILSQYGDQFSSSEDFASPEQTLRRNLLRLEVYFEALNYETRAEAPKYPLSRYISGLGAIIGLFLGCSVLSVLEIVEMFTDALYLGCLKLTQSSHMKPKRDDSHSIISPKIRKRVSPCVLSSMEIEPDENPPSKTSESIFLNPAFQAGPSKSRRIRNRRRSTLDQIFSVTRQNVGKNYEVNRLIPHGRDEGYSSEEGSPVPKPGTTITHKVQLHVPHIVMESPVSGTSDLHGDSQDTKPRTRHEQFLFGRS